MALHLADAQLCADAVVMAVAESLVTETRLDADDLAGSLEDAVRRGVCSRDFGVRVAKGLLPRTAAFDVGFHTGFAARVVERLYTTHVDAPVGGVPNLPYEQLFEAEQAFAHARKLARKTAAHLPGLADFLNPPRDD